MKRGYRQGQALPSRFIAQETLVQADNTFMAENRRSPTINAERSPGEPLLRQGRPADPESQRSVAVPKPEGEQEGGPESKQQPERVENGENPESAVAEAKTLPDDGEFAAGIEKTIAESRQRKLRLTLRQCDRVMLMDFDILAMSDWPDNYTVAVARRSRDLWLFGSLMAALVFLSGMTGFVPAWVAGSGFGVFVILLLSGLPSVRGLVTRKPSYLDLIIGRRRMLQDARKHIQHLEGADGLVWQCAHMAEFNTSLRAMRFNELLALSERRVLAKNMTRREHVRLYLIYMLEAEKAYSRAEKAFFEGHQAALDNGWESVAASSEGRT
jgi:hypothetical protein